MSRSMVAQSPSFHEERGVLESVNTADHADEEHDMQGVLAMRKNLFGSFEKASEQKGNSRILTKPPLAPNNNNLAVSNYTDSTGGSLVDNRLSSLSSSTSSSNSVQNAAAAKSNNMLAVYLRIRPPSNVASAQYPLDCTIEIVDHRAKTEHSEDESNSSPREFPTSILTYPPITSQAYKSIRQTGEGNGSKAVVVSGVKQFNFQRVFGPSDSQRTIYDAVTAPLVAGVFPTIGSDGFLINKGQSALLFAYGITNAGKTYTIMGDDEGRKCGIIPRAIDGILKEIHRREQDATDSCTYQLHASFYEIYNEQVFDLLSGNLDQGQSKKSRTGKDRQPLKIREDKSGYIFVQGLTKHKISSVAEGFHLALFAKSRRQTCSNNINGESSRSHSIYQLQVSVNESNNKEHTTSIFIVDLAGSERARRTGSALNIIQQREAAQINASLMNLMQCIQQLNSNQQRPNSAGAGVVPFRGSKLSHLFMNHLTGASNGKTVMIVNVNPSAADFDETQHVLSYAVVAKNVKIDAAEYNKKVSVISSFQGGSNKVSYDSDKEGGRRKRNAERSKENSASRKIAKLAAGSLRFSPHILVKKDESSMKQGTSAGTAQNKSEIPRQKLNYLVEKSCKLKETNQSHVAEVDSYQRQVAIVHEAENTKFSTLEHENRILLEEVESLKRKILSLQNELSFLKDELVNKEFEIRAEVGDEFEKQIAKIREQYETMRKQQEQKDKDSNTSILVQSTRKIQQDKAEDFVDDLMDKIEECEEELQRLRTSHQDELEKLRRIHKKDLKAKELEIENLQHLHQVVLASKDAEIEKLTIELNLLVNGESEAREINSSSDCDFRPSVVKEMDISADMEILSNLSEVVGPVSRNTETECLAECDNFDAITSSCDSGTKSKTDFDDTSNSAEESNFDHHLYKDHSEDVNVSLLAPDNDMETLSHSKENDIGILCHSKENILIESQNDNSAHRLRLLRPGRCSEVACENVSKLSSNFERGPLSDTSNPPNVFHESESEDDRQELTLRMRLRSRKPQR